MRTKDLYVIAITMFVNLFLACENYNFEDTSAEQGSIYGTIVDFSTGEPIHNANIQLRPSGETTLTGSDGMYEFIDIPEGNYSISVSKAEYTDLIDDYIIKLKGGQRMRRDLMIEKIPTYIRITDMVGQDITGLDFGSNPSTNMLSFSIYNNGTVSIDCDIHYSCKWIVSVSEIPNTLRPGQNVMVTVQIDRSKLDAGNNTTMLYISSNNGSNALLIQAVGDAFIPLVSTLPVTYMDGTITPWCNTFNAEVLAVGNPAYHKRGFCYSATNPNPTINDNRIDVAGTGLGKYSYTYWNFPQKKQIYYVRAWVIYGNNKIQYGEVKSFIYNNV